MDSTIVYDQEFSQEALPTPPVEATRAVKLSAVGRVTEWRKKNPERYKAYQREYMKPYKVKGTP